MSKKKSPARGAGANDPVLAALTGAAQGLTYTSETDAPLEPFVSEAGGGLSAALRRQAGAGAAAPVAEETLDSFFRAVPPEDKAKFDGLARALQAALTGVKVYKVGGDAEKVALIVGQAPDGRWAGLKTTVVET